MKESKSFEAVAWSGGGLNNNNPPILFLPPYQKVIVDR